MADRTSFSGRCEARRPRLPVDPARLGGHLGWNGTAPNLKGRRCRSTHSPIEFLEPLGTNPGYVQSVDETLVLFPPGPALTYAQCKAATRFVHQITTDELAAGAQICVTTKHHRIALLKVTHMPSATGDANAYISFDATVWQGPLS